MSKPKLTGNIRYRVLKRFLRAPVLILQVELIGNVSNYDGGHISVGEQTWWEDCKPEGKMTEAKK